VKRYPARCQRQTIGCRGYLFELDDRAIAICSSGLNPFEVLLGLGGIREPCPGGQPQRTDSGGVGDRPSGDQNGQEQDNDECACVPGHDDGDPFVWIQKQLRRRLGNNARDRV
jgi:hypothetical protein